APLETMRIEDVETAREQTFGELSAALTHGGQVAPQSARELAHKIDAEMGRLRSLAAERHEVARLAREAAHRAALEADDAEARARAVERAMTTIRGALELVSRGDPSGALRRLDEALAAAGLKR